MMNDIRLAANLKWLFAELPLPQRFDAAAASGFTGVEAPEPYGLEVNQFQEIVAQAGVEVVLINTPPGASRTPAQFGAACLPEYRAEFRSGVERGLEYASAVECPLLHIVGGRIPEGLAPELAFATYVSNLCWAAQQASGTQTAIVIEMQNQRSSPGSVLRTQSEAAAVATALEMQVGILFDFFHTQVAGGDVSTEYRRYLSHVAHIQIGDSPGRSEPGTGELSWPFIFDMIRGSGYSGWVGCEFKPDGESASVLQRLRQWM